METLSWAYLLVASNEVILIEEPQVTVGSFLIDESVRFLFQVLIEGAGKTGEKASGGSRVSESRYS
jgi:hypothetical protein